MRILPPEGGYYPGQDPRKIPGKQRLGNFQGKRRQINPATEEQSLRVVPQASQNGSALLFGEVTTQTPPPPKPLSRSSTRTPVPEHQARPRASTETTRSTAQFQKRDEGDEVWDRVGLTASDRTDGGGAETLHRQEPKTLKGGQTASGDSRRLG